MQPRALRAHLPAQLLSRLRLERRKELLRRDAWDAWGGLVGDSAAVKPSTYQGIKELNAEALQQQNFQHTWPGLTKAQSA